MVKNVSKFLGRQATPAPHIYREPIFSSALSWDDRMAIPPQEGTVGTMLSNRAGNYVIVTLVDPEISKGHPGNGQRTEYLNQGFVHT